MPTGGLYDSEGVGIARVGAGAGEWAPFECGSRCYNATHFLWGVTSSVLLFD